MRNGAEVGWRQTNRVASFFEVIRKRECDVYDFPFGYLVDVRVHISSLFYTRLTSPYLFFSVLKATRIFYAFIVCVVPFFLPFFFAVIFFILTKSIKYLNCCPDGRKILFTPRQIEPFFFFLFMFSSVLKRTEMGLLIIIFLIFGGPSSYIESPPLL